MDLGIEDDWFAGKNEPVEPAEPKDMYHEDLKAESDIDPLGEQFFISKPSVFEQEADAFTHTAGATIKDAPAGVGRGVQEALIETAAATSEITTALSGRTSPALTKWLDEQRARVKEAEQAAGEKGVIPIVPVLTSFMLPFSGAMKVLRLVNFAGKLSKGAGMATALGIKARHGASATATLTHKGYQLGRRVDRLTQGVQTVIAASVAGALSSSPEEETLSGAVIDPETSNEMAASIRRVMAAEQGSAEETAAEQAMRRLRNRGRHAAEMAMLTIVIEATLGSIKMLKGRVKEEQPNASPEDILKIMTSAPEMKSKAPKMSQEVTTFHERTAKEGMRIHREAMKNSVASGEVKRGDPIIHPDEYNELVAELQAEGITVPGEKGITRRDFLKGSAATVAATATAAMAVKLGLPPAATTAEVAEAATAAGVPMPAFSSFITDRNAGVLEEKIGDIVRNKAGSWSLSDSVSGMGEAGSGIGPQGYLMPDGTWAEGSVYDDGAYYGQYMAEQLGAEPWYDTIEEVAEMDRYAMMHAEGIPLINPENTPAMISDIVSVEVAEARGWDDNKVDDIISMEVSAPLNEKQINALKVAIGEGRIVDVMFISKPSINTGHQKIGEKTYIDPKDLDAFNADLELARAKHPVNAQGQPLIVKRPLPFDELTSKGGMRRARDAKTSLEAVISGESPAQNLDIDQFSALSEAYETGELTRRLDEAGLSYIDDMMGTLHVGKTPELAKAMQDVHDDIMRQDANTYDIGLLYGYSEGDIAHFYQVRGYGEKAFNEDRKNSEVAPLLDVMNVRERLPGPEATQRLEDAITERAVEMRKSIDKGLNNIINLADKRPAAGSMTDLEIVMDEIGAILKTGKPGDPFVDRATEELQKLNAGITKRGEAAKEAGARLEAIKEQLLAGEISARDVEALRAEMKAKFLSEQITPEETVEYTQRVLDVLRSGQPFPANDLFQRNARVVEADFIPALRDRETGATVDGANHGEAYLNIADEEGFLDEDPEEGFIDGEGRFWTKDEVLKEYGFYTSEELQHIESEHYFQQRILFQSEVPGVSIEDAKPVPAHKYKLTKKDKARVKKLKARVPGLSKVLPYLQDDEVAQLNLARAKKIVELYDKMPSVQEMAAVAIAGRAKRGWYLRSVAALRRIYGEDAPRFAALLAALSPQQSVESNIENAVNVWNGWVAAGRPTDTAMISRIIGENVQGDKGEASVMEAWLGNSLRALQAEDQTAIDLDVSISGPKVNSFMLNLLGFFNEVTNDAWMANYSGVDQEVFASNYSAPMPHKPCQPGPGRRPSH
jgi:hypothetical protein